MPRDDWAKARAKDAARRTLTKAPHPWKVQKNGRRKKRKGPSGTQKPQRQSWRQAIAQTKSHAELSAVARTIAVMHEAGRMGDYQFRTLVGVGQRRRQALNSTATTC